jgi:hypothetical protein
MHSTTVLLLTWKMLLEKHKLAICIMPQDVKTHWNSTYDMLHFALEYKEALKELTSDLRNGLCHFELDNVEWDLMEELAIVLKVRNAPSSSE